MANEDTSLKEDAAHGGYHRAYGAIDATNAEVSSWGYQQTQFVCHRRRQYISLLACLSFLFIVSMLTLKVERHHIETQLELWGMKQAPVRFLNVGDWGRGGAYNQSMIAEQMGVLGESMAAQFVISNGDNFYDEGLSSPTDPFFHESFSSIYTAKSLQTQWYAVLGNHDYYGNVLAQLDKSLANRDPRWLCIRSGTFSRPLCPDGSCSETVQFFMFDTVPMVKSYRNATDKHVVDWRGVDTSDWEAYNAWQLQELEFNLRASNAKWKVVIGHHPVYSYGSHGDQIELIQHVKPILEEYGADLWLNGHDHNMQHIKRDDSPVHFFNSGGGSKAFKTAHPGSVYGLQFFWEGQGFAAFHIGRSYLRVEYYGVFGDQMYSYVLKK